MHSNAFFVIEYSSVIIGGDGSVRSYFLDSDLIYSPRPLAIVLARNVLF
jgi:hypothetical protein